jgi:hypothetical protein
VKDGVGSEKFLQCANEIAIGLRLGC